MKNVDNFYKLVILKYKNQSILHPKIKKKFLIYIIILKMRRKLFYNNWINLMNNSKGNFQINCRFNSKRIRLKYLKGLKFLDKIKKLLIL